MRSTDANQPLGHLLGLRTESGFDVLRVILGLVLLAAAALKVHELATGPVAETNWLTSRWLLIGVVELEFLLVAWLISGAYARPLWSVTLAVFVIFAGVSLYKAVVGDPSCGCFGRISVNPWYTLIFDLCAISGLLVWRPTNRELNANRIRLAPVFLVAALVGIPAAGFMSEFSAGHVSVSGEIGGNEQIVILEPDEWIGKPFPLFSHIDVGEELKTGNWTVVLYHHDCSSCQRAIPQYERIARMSSSENSGSRVALIEMPPYAAELGTLTSPNSPCLLGHLSDEREWFAAAPLEITLQEGRAINAIEHAHPSENADSSVNSPHRVHASPITH